MLISLRIFFLIISVVVGYQMGSLYQDLSPVAEYFGMAIGVVAAFLIVVLELFMRKASVRGLSAAVFGLLFGLLMAKIVTWTVQLFLTDERLISSLGIIFLVAFCYIGMIVAIRGKDEFNIIVPYVKFSKQNQREDPILLDTSVIIDGRIADICQTKFIEGKLVIPRFILNELQHIADSQDALKRNRGRRGLDILNKIQKQADLAVKIIEDDFDDIKEVDSKLIKLAKIMDAKVLTNDYNLNKIAELQGVGILNINDLANALKPVVLPGEIMDVKLIKDGKEFNQAVAYLDDGTMIVVDNAKPLIGKNAQVVVTSVLQTSAGRMIFAKLGSNNRGKTR
ncbi:MAG: hypothetical protein AUJ75_02565 [Candidatus Omnitrophica bacterium CG1_02_49_10]|nr:MAG: hypothetical protein AUJ75_02565 [Candidatus Omnitrophica bacterium CG1_02_49_10]